MSPRKTLLIVYHSQSGATRQMADAVIRGARDPEAGEVIVDACSPFDADPARVLSADGYLFGTPENFGYMSGALKDFFDRIYYPCLDQLNGRPYGLFVRAGNDGSGAVSSVERIVKGLALRRVAEPVVIAGELDPERLAECTALGMTMTAGLDGGIF